MVSKLREAIPRQQYEVAIQAAIGGRIIARETVKAMAARFDLSETEVVHMALSRMAKEELPAYEADEGPLSARDVRALGKIADAALPRGRVVRKQSLF